nr:hypothetical protein CFP56_76282 [Quercus suber]
MEEMVPYGPQFVAEEDHPVVLGIWVEEDESLRDKSMDIIVDIISGHRVEAIFHGKGMVRSGGRCRFFQCFGTYEGMGTNSEFRDERGVQIHLDAEPGKMTSDIVNGASIYLEEVTQLVSIPLEDGVIVELYGQFRKSRPNSGRGSTGSGSPSPELVELENPCRSGKGVGAESLRGGFLLLHAADE